MTYRTVLIGKNLEVVFSTNPTDLHCRGTVVDETQNMIQIENRKLKWLIKKNVVVLLDGHLVDGRDLVGRPEDRIKR
ncbi:MAG: ribonuclease P protein subunit [Theionarchaea archaeon]|nr:ribonuclease P protein subunit [Theionarchaea archaeon]